jgi:hypothetical protein
VGVYAVTDAGREIIRGKYAAKTLYICKQWLILTNEMASFQRKTEAACENPFWASFCPVAWYSIATCTSAHHRGVEGCSSSSIGWQSPQGIIIVNPPLRLQDRRHVHAITTAEPWDSGLGADALASKTEFRPRICRC